MPQKDWYQSTTVWGAILAVFAPILGQVIHQQVPADFINQCADALAAIGGVIAIIGRMRASTTIMAAPPRPKESKPP